MNEDILMERVLQMTSDISAELKGEATYVITNALTCCSEEKLVQFT